MNFERTLDAIYKISVVILLVVAVFLLRDIKAKQQTTPITVGDMRTLNEIKDEKIRDAIVNQIPVVNVSGAITVDEVRKVNTVNQILFPVNINREWLWVERMMAILSSGNLKGRGSEFTKLTMREAKRMVIPGILIPLYGFVWRVEENGISMKIRVIAGIVRNVVNALNLCSIFTHSSPESTWIWW
jgi:hypothetical protein